MTKKGKNKMSRAKSILWAIILVVGFLHALPVTAQEDDEENPWAGIGRAINKALDTAADIGAEAITGAAGEMAKEAGADPDELPPGYMDGMKDITRGMLDPRPGKSSQALETGMEKITGSMMEEFGIDNDELSSAYREGMGDITRGLVSPWSGESGEAVGRGLEKIMDATTGEIMRDTTTAPAASGVSRQIASPEPPEVRAMTPVIPPRHRPSDNYSSTSPRSRLRWPEETQPSTILGSAFGTRMTSRRQPVVDWKVAAGTGMLLAIIAVGMAVAVVQLRKSGSGLPKEATIELLVDHSLGTRVKVDKVPFRLGRNPDCELRFADRLVSGLHAYIDYANDQARLIDCGSTNGTFVNGQRIVDGQVLQAGDEIRIGNSTIWVG